MPKGNVLRPRPMTRVGTERTPQQIIEDILDRAYRGELTPDEAEGEARKWGFGPLAVHPPPEKHDPQNKPAWTFPMAWAWIVTRDAETVMWHDDLFRMEVLEWVGRGKGYDLIQPCPMTMVIAELGLKDDPSIDADWSARERLVSGAKADLLKALALGVISATGVHGSDGPVQVIPTHEWAHLALFQTLDADYLAFEHSADEVAYSRVKLPIGPVLKVWPARPVSVPKSTAALETACRAWLRAMVAQSPEKATTTRTKFMADATERFPGLSVRAIKRVWNEELRNYPKWTRPGPKGSGRRANNSAQ